MGNRKFLSGGLFPVHPFSVSQFNDNGETTYYESKPHYDIEWHNGDGDGSSKSSGKALIIGKEGTGLSKQVREAFARGDIRTIHVPMEPGIESLNAAVCGSVVMFEYHRQGLTKNK